MSDKPAEFYKMEVLVSEAYDKLLRFNPAIAGTKTGGKTRSLIHTVAYTARRLVLKELHTELMKNEYANSRVLGIIEEKLKK